MINSWRKVKRSGAFHRHVRKESEKFVKRAKEIENLIIASRGTVILRPATTPMKSPIISKNPDKQLGYDPSTNFIATSLSFDDFTEKTSVQGSEYCMDENISDDIIDDGNEEEDQKFRNNMRKWAISNNITHIALRDLIKTVKKRFDKDSIILPDDPRTLLRTPQSVLITKVPGGEYWHNGLRKCLKKLFANLTGPKTISINVNMDGLPVYNSSKVEFWPILANIHELPQIAPMPIGIFCGKTKAHNLDPFLMPFVEELREIMSNGIYINSHKLSVRLRCFVCDSPARAFIKGVANFNGWHGCLKCTTVGFYHHDSRTNVLPYINCARRTDEKFRLKLYGEHHKTDSPLLKLDIDMVEQFPIGDSLHLLHLGVMKRLLLGWRDGSFRNANTKWRARAILEVSDYLNECKLPKEFQRATRGLDCLSNWKGTELRSFLHYIGIVVLKDQLQYNVYEHFLLLFCGVTICSSKRYFQYLQVARSMLNQFIEIFIEIYGMEYVTSNIHNLAHLVDEVERYGELDSFSAYPFETMLGKMKRMVRTGSKPLPQIANRLVEIYLTANEGKQTENLESKSRQYQRVVMTKENLGENVPTHLKLFGTEDIAFFSKIQLNEYCLRSDDSVNCWFLTNTKEIARLINIISLRKNYVKLCCIATGKKFNFFTLPIESRYLDIYHTHYAAHIPDGSIEIKLFDICDIECKLIRLKYNGEMNVFLPLLHTKQTLFMGHDDVEDDADE